MIAELAQSKRFSIFMRKVFLLTTLLCWIASIAWAQTRQLTGRVVNNENGTALSGASVGVKGTTRGSVTGDDGKFTLSIPSKGTTILVITSVGFVNQEITVTNQTSLNVNMVSESKSLEDVVSNLERYVPYITYKRQNER